MITHTLSSLTESYQSLISLMVSVDVKHHVYLLNPQQTRSDEMTARRNVSSPAFASHCITMLRSRILFHYHYVSD